MSSWYDAYVRTTFDNYEGFSRSGQRPLRLIMGPGLHGNRNSTFAGDVEFGPTGDARGKRDAVLARVPAALVRPLAEEPSRTASTRSRRCGCSSWAAARAQERSGQARSWREMDRSAALAVAGGRAASPSTSMTTAELSPTRSARDIAPLSYDFDPSDPVPTIGGALTSGQPVFEGGALRPARSAAVLRLPQPRACRSRRGGTCCPSRPIRSTSGRGGDRADQRGVLGRRRTRSTPISPRSLSTSTRRRRITRRATR